MESMQIFNSIGNLFSLFCNEITISHADIRNAISTQYFKYLSNSNASLSAGRFADLSVEETGGFGSIFEDSKLHNLDSELTRFRNVQK